MAELYLVTGNQVVRDFKELNDSSISIELKDPPSKPANWQIFKDNTLLVSLIEKEPDSPYRKVFITTSFIPKVIRIQFN